LLKSRDFAINNTVAERVIELKEKGIVDKLGTLEEFYAANKAVAV